MSQAQLGSSAGLSRRMITSIESGAANISLATVDRLAAALEVSFTHLVRDPQARDNARIEILGWQGNQPESRAVLLGSAPGKSETELWIWSLAPGEVFASEEIAGTWHEAVLVLQGQLTLSWSNRREILNANDFSIFNSKEPYRFSNEEASTLFYVRILVL